MKKKEAKTSFDKISIVFLALLIILSIVLTSFDFFPKKTLTTEEFFSKMDIIDNKFGVDYHKERINKDTVKLGLIPRVIQSYEELDRSIPETEENKGFHDFIELRILQLETQEAFQKSRNIMKINLYASKENPIYCDRKEDALKALSLLETVSNNGIEWSKKMDDLLQKNKDLRPIVGTNAEKPRFYIFRYQDLPDLINEYRYAYTRLC